MRNRKRGAIALCESLESRRLLSSTVPMLRAEVNTLQTDGTSLKTAIRTLESSLQVIPAGASGLGELSNDLKQFKTDLTNADTQVMSDFTKLLAARGTFAQPTRAARLSNHLAADLTLLKADSASAKEDIASHPALSTDDVNLVADEAAVLSAFGTLKHQIAQLRTSATNLVA
jgi:hypothetical protein